MGDFALAEAFISVRPDFAGFREDMDANLRRATLGKKIDIPVTTDASQAQAKMAGLRAQVLETTKRLADMRGAVHQGCNVVIGRWDWAYQEGLRDIPADVLAYITVGDGRAAIDAASATPAP
jgi:hypothetical protein